MHYLKIMNKQINLYIYIYIYIYILDFEFYAELKMRSEMYWKYLVYFACIIDFSIVSVSECTLEI